MSTKPKSGLIGTPMPRLEDERILRGFGKYVDDIKMPREARAYFLRSNIAHGLIKNIDVSEAYGVSGVLAIYTAEDWISDGMGEIPCVSIPPTITGKTWFKTPFKPLAKDRVLCVGQPIVMVIAESLFDAMDAAELIKLDIESLPSVTSVEKALDSNAPLVWPENKSNICFTHELGNKETCDLAFKNAYKIVEFDTYNQRLASNTLEPRGCLAFYDFGEDRYHLHSSTANPHRIRLLLAENLLKVPAHRVHVVASDVGGGFGTKGGIYPEEALVTWACKKVGRPIKWICERSESFVSDFNGRDQYAKASIAVNEDGKVLGLKVESNYNLGCQLGPSTAHPALIGARMLSGVYDIPAMHVVVRGLFTNTQTLTTYRGAGRPEATYIVERLMDLAAYELSMDPVDIRRKNLIQAHQMPFKTAINETYDSGDFPQIMEKTLLLADVKGFSERKQESAKKGLRRGLGVSMYIEVCGTVSDRMEIRFDPTGTATILAGTFSYGQGHHTSFAQMTSDWLGINPKDIRFVQGDTDKVAYGRGSFGSRTMTIGGSALKIASDQIISLAKEISAFLNKCSVDELKFKDGHVVSDREDLKSYSLQELAKETYKYGTTLPPHLATGLQGVGFWSAPPQNYPNGCYVVEVEITESTGQVTLDKITAIDDVGNIINPLIFEGQVHGGIAQGVGQALMEQIVYDDSGQVVTGSFIDYAMPKAEDFPLFTLGSLPVPTKTNLLGVKGGAETGTVGIPPAIINAVVNALSDLGIKDIPMPAIPGKVWKAIQLAKKGASHG
jgi:carbon-monoxide dehydrogenase large subunit